MYLKQLLKKAFRFSVEVEFFSPVYSFYVIVVGIQCHDGYMLKRKEKKKKRIKLFFIIILFIFAHGMNYYEFYVAVPEERGEKKIIDFYDFGCRMNSFIVAVT